jgi:hypothetical protein
MPHCNTMLGVDSDLCDMCGGDVDFKALTKADNLPLLPVSETAVDCLRKIADPITHMRKQAEESGGELNGIEAIALSNDANYIKQLATDWLQSNSR